jgi:hypothetical protein
MLFQIFFLVINLVPGIGPVFFITRKKDYVGLVDKLVLALIFSPLVIVLVSFFELMYFLVFVLIICLSWFIYWLLERTLLWGKYQLATGVIIVCGLGAVFLLGGLNEYHHYLDVQAAATTVEKMDLEAFDYIEGDVSDGKKLLIQIGYDDQLRLIVGADSGAWITPYTGKEVEVSWLDNSAPSSFEIYQLYLLVAGNGNDLDAIMKLYCDYDIGYVFFGSRRVYSNNMDSRVLATSPYFERVFSNGAALFRIKPLECPAG